MWNIYQPVNVLFGEGRISEISDVLDKYQIKKAFLICGNSMERAGFADKLMEYANGKIVAKHVGVSENADLDDVNLNAKLAKEAGADCIIGMGGGSAMDCAKSVAVCVGDDCTAEDLLADGDMSKAHKVQNPLPVIAIPTTSGTGDEVTRDAALCDKVKNIHSGVLDPKIFPITSIVDPEVTYTMPPKVTANTGFDAMSHAIDALGSVHHNPFSDALAIEALKHALANLEEATLHGDNKEARREMAMAGTIAGFSFSQTGIAAVHAFATALSAVYEIPHGEACAFTMDKWIVLDSTVRPEINDYARQLGFEDAKALGAKITDMKKTLGLKTTITECGGSEADIPLLVTITRGFFSINDSVLPVTDEEITQMYRDLL